MKRVNLQFHHCFHLYHSSHQFVSYCFAFPASQGCNKMCFNEYGPRNTPTLHDFWASANLGVYKLTGAILIGGVRWHQTFPRWGGPRVGWFELSRILPVACGTSYRQSVGGPAGWLIWVVLNPTSCLWDLLLSISWCAASSLEQCTTTGVVLCSKCELASSLEQCTRLGQAWVQWQLLRELPRSFLVVIETLWVLCNCLMTHSFCVWAGCLCFSTVLLTVAKVKLAGVKW